MIEFSHVSAAYGNGTPVFSDWSASIPKRSVTTILGANGTGKTTLLKCLTNQLRPCKGDISIDGKPVPSLSSKALARKIAYVPQNCDAAIDYTVLDFICFGRTPYLHLLESPSDEDYRLARDIAEKHGIAHLAGKSISAISGGERQLVYIARALVQDTPVIIMDEPMSALDFGHQAVILGKIVELRDSGKTVIFTSHNPNHALAISSRVLVIDREKQIIQGDARELLRDQQLLERTFGARVRYFPSNQGGYVTFTAG